MEFPEDVCGLIRAFSKPRMRFVHEYHQAMRALGEADWPDVKRRLCDKDAEQVIAALFAYTDSVLQLQDSPLQDRSEQVMKRNSCERALRVLLVGEEKVFRYERWLVYDTQFREWDSE
jgi:hypothetical protein